MASNRLFLYDPETKTAFCIAKGYGTGWSSYPSDTEIQRLNNFFDDAQEFTSNIKATRYELKTERELADGTRIYWADKTEIVQLFKK
ncbi:hypothetical protein LCGC14_2513480 [marine sediment metagenome]|uniref:Uncharacterized protein n=1 Tax=marine sediment metagenome TaxID=412755 RepID=A0A0F9DA59_9ZZZZ